MDHGSKKCNERRRCCVQNICRQEMKNGRRMAGCLRRHKLVAALNGCLAAGVGIRRRALALLTAIRRLLIELSASEAVEWTYEQKNCQNGDGDVHRTAHLFHITIPEATWDCTGPAIGLVVHG